MSLSKVKAGDTLVIVSTRNQSQAVTVDRTTKTQIIVSSTRYRRDNGYRVGLAGQIAWACDFIRLPLNEREITEITRNEQHRTLCHRIARNCKLHQLRHLSLESLEQLNTVLTEVCQKPKEVDDGR